MVKTVIKKSGQREIFDLEKIRKSLTSVLKEAGYQEEEVEKINREIIEKISKFLEKKEEIFTSEIEAKIILELEKISSKAVNLWREFRVRKEHKN